MTSPLDFVPLLGRYVHLSRPLRTDDPEEVLGAQVNGLDPTNPAASMTVEGTLVGIVEDLDEHWTFALLRVDGITAIIKVRPTDPDYRVSAFISVGARESICGPVQITGSPTVLPDT